MRANTVAEGHDVGKVLGWFGFVPTAERMNELVGDCPFCFKENHFYASTITGEWSCKSSVCNRNGNLYSFMRQWITLWHELAPPDEFSNEWQMLEAYRGISRWHLYNEGVVYCPIIGKFALPVYNQSGAITNVKVCTVGTKLMGVPGFPSQLFGGEFLANGSKKLYLCEGEWDVLALRRILKEHDLPGYVIGIPGAGVLKEDWIPLFAGKDITVIYDHDPRGVEGSKRLHAKLFSIAQKFSILWWPDEFDDGYDINDAYRDALPVKSLFDCIQAQDKPLNSNSEGKSEAVGGRVSAFVDRQGQKASFIEVIKEYRKWLEITDDMEIALRVSYAVALSQFIPGDPLWMYLVAPPSSGKTVILQSMSEVDYCILKSTLTPASLVSGFRSAEGADPSLIPLLDGNVFVLKDFTEILGLQRAIRDDIFSTLRGAYDGSVEKQFGNGILRKYECHFSMVAGVTQAIFGDRNASLGERFLMLHIMKGNDTYADSIIRKAMTNVGYEDDMKVALGAVAKNYLEMRVAKWEVEQAEESMSDQHLEQILGLASVSAMLRGQVMRDIREERILYRPQLEIGARLAKQLKKLAIALALLQTPIAVNNQVIHDVTRVAMDTCIGFNFEIMQALLLLDEQSVTDLCKLTQIPAATLRTCVEDLELLGVVQREKTANPVGKGAPIALYSLTDRAKYYIEMSGLSRNGYLKNYVEHNRIAYRRKV